MITLHQPYRGPARTGRVMGESPDTPPRRPCDKCGALCSSYNQYGRCHPCADTHGWPQETPAQTPVPPTERERRRLRPRKGGGHTPDCRCWELRVPLRDGYGIIVERTAGDGIEWALPVTCPTCGDARLVRSKGHRGMLCQKGYLIRCKSCANRAQTRPVEAAAA